jgi:hypothetical protein
VWRAEQIVPSISATMPVNGGLVNKALLAPRLLLLAAVVVGGTARADDPGDDMRPDPALKARVVSVDAQPTIEKIKGDCALIRDHAPGPTPRRGTWLHEGDILDLGKHCAITLAVVAHKSVPLHVADGRFVRIEFR